MITAKKEILKLLTIAGKGQSTIGVFFDWITMMALSIANTIDFLPDEVTEEREKQWFSIAKKYENDSFKALTEATELLSEELEKRPYDILGEIYEELRVTNKNTAQYFTPSSISVVNAGLLKFEDKKVNKVYEPCCGSGSMVLAIAEEMRKQDINFCCWLHVKAEDVDWNCVYMSYVQMSFAGINAIVCQKDVLNTQKITSAQRFFTPMYVMTRTKSWRNSSNVWNAIHR